MTFLCPECNEKINPFSMLCTSCNKQFTDDDAATTPEPDYKSEYQAVAIHSETEFPDFCHRCDAPTNSVVKIKGHDKTHVSADLDRGRMRNVLTMVGTAFFVVVATFFAGCFGFVFSLTIGTLYMFYNLVSEKRQQDFSVAVLIPTCSNCNKRRILPLDVSWERATLTLELDSNFAARLKQQSK